MRTKLIFNPLSNQGQAASFLPTVKARVAGNPEYDLALTEYHGHAIALAKAAAEENFERVIAMGGDGTTHEVVNGLMQFPEAQRPEVGIVPLGSGNDFTFSAGLRGTPEEMLAIALQGPSHAVDIGLMEDNLNRREYWVNSLGIGFDALINIYSRGIHLFKGFWVYLLAALQTVLFHFTSFQFSGLKDGAVWRDNLLMLIVANGIREGGTFMVAPNASLQDGCLNYSAVPVISRPQMLRVLIAYIQGNQNKLRSVEAGSFGSLELQAERPLIIHSDGEILAGLDSKVTRLKIQSVPAAIRLVTRG
jgi:YegS/Rv2252/BmrU family lipid kinase